MILRAANVADARAIATVHVETWRAAYRGQLPDTYLDSLSVPERAERWHNLLGRGAPTWVLVSGGRVLGFASAGADRQGQPDTGEIYALYIYPDYWGTGAGRALLEHATERLGEAGYRSGVLWVLESNTRARRFYERGGWRPDGAQKCEAIGGAAAIELRYRRALPPLTGRT